MDSDLTPATGTPEGSSSTDGAPPIDAAALAAEVEKWKAHSRQWEKRAKEAAPAAAKLAELEQSQLSEIERVTNAAQEAEARASALAEKATAALVRSAVVSSATRHQVIDPDAVLAFIDRQALTIGDDDSVSGVDEAVKAVLAAKPYLVAKSNPAPGAADGGPQGKSASAYTREDIAKLDPSERTRLWREGAFNHLTNT